MPPTLDELFAELAAKGVDINSQEDLEHLLYERPELRDRFAVAMQDAVPSLARELNAFLGAQTWNDSQRVAEQHPELLSAEADTALGKAIEVA
jgi:hypothetical protein